MRKFTMLAAMLLLTLSVAACGQSSAGSSNGESGAGSSGGESGASSGGEKAADFSVTTLDGDEFNLADKQGEVVALFFMAAY